MGFEGRGPLTDRAGQGERGAQFEAPVFCARDFDRGQLLGASRGRLTPTEGRSIRNTNYIRELRTNPIRVVTCAHMCYPLIWIYR